MPTLWETPHGSFLSSLPGHGTKGHLHLSVHDRGLQSIYNKFNLRENKKRKTGGASTSREQPNHYEVENNEFWDDLEIHDEEV